ncbi:hypothetical protein B0H13DRAFT_1854226 [Mycena leptocephala]|nr:hypothetical protein B0H13DRAFT_1854226 [Mycena leptocephala]
MSSLLPPSSLLLPRLLPRPPLFSSPRLLAFGPPRLCAFYSLRPGSPPWPSRLVVLQLARLLPPTPPSVELPSNVNDENKPKDDRDMSATTHQSPSPTTSSPRVSRVVVALLPGQSLPIAFTRLNALLDPAYPISRSTPPPVDIATLSPPEATIGRRARLSDVQDG